MNKKTPDCDCCHYRMAIDGIAEVIGYSGHITYAIVQAVEAATKNDRDKENGQAIEFLTKKVKELRGLAKDQSEIMHKQRAEIEQLKGENRILRQRSTDPDHLLADLIVEKLIDAARRGRS